MEARSRLFAGAAPAYTIRMLVGNVTSEQKEETPKLKDFSHFTLGCTSEDKTREMSDKFEALCQLFEGSVSFGVKEVINLGSKEKSLWAISLDLGKNEENIRNHFSALFDPIMCAEQNGTQYLWKTKNVEAGKVDVKTPHVTIGSGEAAEKIAKKLLELKCQFSFDRVDYKRVGPHDPLLSQQFKSMPASQNVLSR